MKKNDDNVVDKIRKSLGNQGMIKALDNDDGSDVKKKKRRKKKQDTGRIEKKKTRRQNKLKATRAKYEMGMHGAKKREQTRLTKKFGIDVTGDTHESEHVIGFEPLNQTSGDKRGSGTEVRQFENRAYAYQEMKELHRDHIGTGNKGSEDDTGFTAQSYRDSQRSLVEDGDISSAVQLNQLGYAFDPNKSQLTSTTEGKAATDSFNKMVSGMTSVEYASGSEKKHVPVDAKQRAEMHLSRQVVETGKFPTVDEENAIRKMYGLDPYEEKKKDDKNNNNNDDKMDMT